MTNKLIVSIRLAKNIGYNQCKLDISQAYWEVGQDIIHAGILHQEDNSDIIYGTVTIKI